MANYVRDQANWYIDTVDEGAGSASVGASTAVLVAANTDRTYFAVTNTHASQTISLGFGTDAVDGAGIVLDAGDTWEMPSHAIFTGAINVIGSGVGTTYAYVEW